MALYKLLSFGVLRTSDGACIPADLRNTDYLAYGDWLTAGNVPDPADVPVPLTAAQLALAQLVAQDNATFRMLEALVDVLLAKGVIAGADFRADIRALYIARKAIRAAAGVP
jgi:hypothetical protein